MTVFVFIKLNALASDIPYIVMTVFVFIKLNALASDTPFIVMVCVFIKLNVLTTLLVEAHHTLCVNRIWMHTSINPDWSRPYIVWYQLWTHWHHSWLKQTIHYEGGGGGGGSSESPWTPSGFATAYKETRNLLRERSISNILFLCVLQYFCQSSVKITSSVLTK